MLYIGILKIIFFAGRARWGKTGRMVVLWTEYEIVAYFKRSQIGVSTGVKLGVLLLVEGRYDLACVKLVKFANSDSLLVLEY